jgi:hypothetical protein
MRQLSVKGSYVAAIGVVRGPWPGPCGGAADHATTSVPAHTATCEDGPLVRAGSGFDAIDRQVRVDGLYASPRRAGLLRVVTVCQTSNSRPSQTANASFAPNPNRPAGTGVHVLVTGSNMPPYANAPIVS